MKKSLITGLLTMVGITGVVLPALSAAKMPSPQRDLPGIPTTGTMLAYKLGVFAEVASMTPAEKSAFEAYIQNKGLASRGRYQNSELTGKRQWVLIDNANTVHQIVGEMQKESFGRWVSAGL